MISQQSIYVSYDQFFVEVFNSNFRYSLHMFTSRDGLAIDAFAVDYYQFAFILFTLLHVCNLHTFCRLSYDRL